MTKQIATRKQIKIRMLERDTSVIKIARSAEVSAQAIQYTLAGTTKASRLRSAIASALGWPESRIWGA